MPGILDFPDLPAPRTPAHDLLDLGWSGLRALFPNLTNPSTYAPLPPPPWTPTPEGKLPSSDRDPRIEGASADLVNLGLMLAPMPGAGAALGAARYLPRLAQGSLPRAESLASRSVSFYNPPIKPPRPISADYPLGAPADAAGRLTQDIEGRPLVAGRIVGRRVAGGADEALPATEFDALAEATTGARAQVVPARQMGQDAGRVVLNRYTRQPEGIELRSNLTPEQLLRVYAHELGYGIDEIAGQVTTQGLSKELKGNYNTLNNPNRGYPDRSEAAPWGKPFTPQALGYKGDEVGREYIVEAIRAYLADPNYLKTVAPKTAAAIRAAVNSHPTLSKIIQFNSIAAPAALGVDLDSLPIPRQPAPMLF
jgi:hypothetical protein